jgi:hypothetical protein
MPSAKMSKAAVFSHTDALDARAINFEEKSFNF